jgi:hypothetical protein
MTESPSQWELAERYYLAFCQRFQLDPEDQQSAVAFEKWWMDLHGDQ